jgi:hypothetical protein
MTQRSTCLPLYLRWSDSRDHSNTTYFGNYSLKTFRVTSAFKVQPCCVLTFTLKMATSVYAKRLGTASTFHTTKPQNRKSHVKTL